VVTVVIPSKDRRDRVLSAVRSALAQEGVEVDVVVVDDGSSDGTAEAVAAVPGARAVRHAVNRGVAEARNSGIAAARGDWVAFLDDDDLWAPDKLARQLAAAERAGRRWAFASALVVDERGLVVGTEDAPDPERFAEDLAHYNAVPAGSSNVMAHRSLLDECGTFDPQLHHYADWDLWLRFVGREPPAVVGEPLVAYLSHPTSMRVADIGTAVAEFRVLSSKFEARSGRPLDDGLILQWLAEGHAQAGDHLAAARILLRAGVGRRSRWHLRNGLVELGRATRLLRPRAAKDLGPAPAWARVDVATRTTV
jgi:glycosyltransferase involved in cell wall biosynthesis